MALHWHQDAEDFIERYRLDRQFVEDVVRSPQATEVDPRTQKVGYQVLRLRRGDIEVVVGYREPREPMVLFVRLLSGDNESPRHSVGGTKGSSIPPTLPELRRRITMYGYTITHDARHSKVLSTEGHLIAVLPKTPSDHRSLANSWRAFMRGHEQYLKGKKESGGA